MNNAVTVLENKIAVEIIEQPVAISVTGGGPRGPKGDAGVAGATGAAGSSGAETLTAGEVISAFRAVYTGVNGKFFLLSSDDTENAPAFIGLTKEAVIADQVSEIHTFGIIENSGWNLTPNQAVFVDSLGRITNTPPTGGANLFVGHAVTATKIYLNSAELTIIGE